MTSLEELGLAELHLIHDRATGLRAAVAIHDVALGPARGGTRLWTYPSFDAGVAEAARLARAMTRKMAIHRLPFGGGKAVIVQDAAGAADPELTAARLRRYGRFVRRLGHVFGTGPDMGIGAVELAVLQEVCPGQIAGAHSHGEASRATAGGVRACLEAALGQLGRELAGARVGVLGVGAVGGALARELAERGATLTLADLDAGRVEALASELGADVLAPEALLRAELDALAPCAGGQLLDADAIASLRCAVLAGGANDVLVAPEPARAQALAARGVLFVPDYVANGGAAVALTGCDREAESGAAQRAAAAVGETCREVLARAESDGVTPWEAADAIVVDRLRRGRASAGPVL